MQFWVNSGEGQSALTESEMALRNEFVRNYLIDYDEVLACMRVGFSKAFAETWAIRLMSEPYVQQRITTLTQTTPDDEGEQERLDKELTLSVLREAAQRGPYSSRVAAAAKLAAILGMDKPIANTLDITNRGGVMIVPGTASIDDWETTAVKAQQDLINAAQE
jgi:propanediol utilization protein